MVGDELLRYLHRDHDEYGFKIIPDYEVGDMKLLAKIQALEIRSHNLLLQVGTMSRDLATRVNDVELTFGLSCRRVVSAPFCTAGRSTWQAGRTTTSARLRSSKVCYGAVSLTSTGHGSGGG